MGTSISLYLLQTSALQTRPFGLLLDDLPQPLGLAGSYRDTEGMVGLGKKMCHAQVSIASTPISVMFIDAAPNALILERVSIDDGLRIA